jgi:hypothetical protein
VPAQDRVREFTCGERLPGIGLTQVDSETTQPENEGHCSRHLTVRHAALFRTRFAIKRPRFPRRGSDVPAGNPVLSSFRACPWRFLRRYLPYSESLVRFVRSLDAGSRAWCAARSGEPKSGASFGQSLGSRLCNQHEQQRLLRSYFMTKLTDPDRCDRFCSIALVQPHPRMLHSSFAIGSKSG